MQKLVVGVDEAGYGPNLGPLSLGCTCWLQSDAFPFTDWTTRLEPVFSPYPLGSASKAKSGIRWIPVGDSKMLYNSKLGVKSLKLGVESLAMVAGWEPEQSPAMTSLSARELASWVDRGSLDRTEKRPWFAPSSPSRKGDALMFGGLQGSKESEDCNGRSAGMAELAELGRRHLQSQGLRLKSVHGWLVDEQQFNRDLSRWGNKSTLLTATTLTWVAEIVQSTLHRHPEITEIEIACDKHGGRNRYAGALTQFFPDVWFTAEMESRETSRYRGKWGEVPMTIAFTAKGDTFPPTAAASMIAKYDREIMMERFNRYWLERIPGLLPTAGYPVDALRFAKSIEPHASKDGWSREDWWRMA